MKPGCILTDVGSTKAEIHRAAEALGLDACFIGGHPMAGSEKSGYAYATDHLVENAYYVLTPGKGVAAKAVQRFKGLIAGLGAIVLTLEYERHDYVVAAISHLPHLIASSLVNLVRDCDDEAHTMKTVAAGGFKDITRIASSSPYRLFDEAREFRDSIPGASMGPLKKDYSVYCDIVDESGAIATIATILASHQINIKNIGILHNREFEEGVLKVDFYDQESADQAAAWLAKFQYRLFKR